MNEYIVPATSLYTLDQLPCSPVFGHQSIITQSHWKAAEGEDIIHILFAQLHCVLIEIQGSLSLLLCVYIATRPYLQVHKLLRMHQGCTQSWEGTIGRLEVNRTVSSNVCPN